MLVLLKLSLYKHKIPHKRNMSPLGRNISLLFVFYMQYTFLLQPLQTYDT